LVVSVGTEAEDIGEDTVEWGGLVRAVANCRLYELAMAIQYLQLLSESVQ
jgi:hypothetical protein